MSVGSIDSLGLPQDTFFYKKTEELVSRYASGIIEKEYLFGHYQIPKDFDVTELTEQQLYVARRIEMVDLAASRDPDLFFEHRAIPAPEALVEEVDASSEEVSEVESDVVEKYNKPQSSTVKHRWTSEEKDLIKRELERGKKVCDIWRDHFPRVTQNAVGLQAFHIRKKLGIDSGQHRWTAEKKDLIKRELERGKKVCDIWRDHFPELTHEAVRNQASILRKKFGIGRRNYRWTAEETDLIQRERQEGKSIRDIWRDHFPELTYAALKRQASRVKKATNSSLGKRARKGSVDSGKRARKEDKLIELGKV